VNQSGTFSIRFSRTWQADASGRQFRFEPGSYRVPTDVPMSIANMAIKQGAAVKVLHVLETKSLPEPVVLQPRMGRKGKVGG